MIQRLRPTLEPGALAEIYQTPHDASKWADHVERVETTVEFALDNISRQDLTSVADLSCGNGYIAWHVIQGGAVPVLGDFAPGYEYTGPIEKTIYQIPAVKTFVCSETLEHVDDPGLVLALIRTRADTLILSTPIDAWNDPNPEHYWAWDRAGVEDVMRRSGWRPLLFKEFDGRQVHPASYRFGIWIAG